MALRHHAFLFDIHAFHKSISSLIVAVDRGDLLPLFDQANKIIKDVAPDVWLFDDVGSPLMGRDEIHKVNFAGVPRTQPITQQLADAKAVHPGDIGYWLLIVMSRYLEKSSGIGSNYSILETALTNMGWSHANRERLFYGLPTCLLLMSNCTRVSLRTDKDPYWHWIVPPHAQSSGWLPPEEVVRLVDHLASMQPRIQSYDPQLFPNPWQLTGEALIDSQHDFFVRLHNAYDEASVMLRQAQQSNRGVFMVMAY